jgi:RNA polymerase sigma factor (TIGR02999 family)
MPSRTSATVTRLLQELGSGRPGAFDLVLPLVYTELRTQAGRALRRERREHTLDTAALVNETYLRLVGQRELEPENRAHFLALAARTMREVLVDHARRRGARKRGGERARVALEDVPATTGAERLDLLALDEALTRLAAFDAELARVVELRFFAGQTIEATAATLGVSPATVKRDWAAAKAWLRRDMGPADTS